MYFERPISLEEHSPFPQVQLWKYKFFRPSNSQQLKQEIFFMSEIERRRKTFECL
jgi:hypothetical protein